MERYKKETCEKYYIRDLSNVTDVKYLALKRIKPTGNVLLNDVANTKLYKEYYGDYDYDFGDSTTPYYSYDDVIMSAKKLFGPNFNINLKDNNYIPDEDRGDPDCSCFWYYIEELDKFVELSNFCGRPNCYRYTEKLAVSNYEFIDDKLYINTIKEDKVGANTPTPSKEVTKHQYIFKKQGNDYYMIAIKEIK